MSYRIFLLVKYAPDSIINKKKTFYNYVNHGWVGEKTPWHTWAGGEAGAVQESTNSSPGFMCLVGARLVILLLGTTTSKTKYYIIYVY